MLSHGQADVERGLSKNKQVEIENLKEETLVAQRIVAEYNSKNKLVITKEMRMSVAMAQQKYMTHLEEQRNKKKNSIQNEKR